MRALQKACNDFNRENPIGTDVILKLDSGERRLTRTRSVAQVMQGHSAVIWLEGISGCYLLSRVETFTVATSARGARDIIAECKRQVDDEGFTTGHDDQHADAEMVTAAINYAAASGIATKLGAEAYDASPPFTNWMQFDWPWDRSWWKPGDRRRMLIKAVSLLIREIERIDRLSINLRGEK